MLQKMSIKNVFPKNVQLKSAAGGRIGPYIHIQNAYIHYAAGFPATLRNTSNTTFPISHFKDLVGLCTITELLLFPLIPVTNVTLCDNKHHKQVLR